MKQIATILIFSLFTSICYAQIITYELVKFWNVSEIENIYIENAIPDYAGDINFGVKGYDFYLTPNEKILWLKQHAQFSYQKIMV